MSDGFRVVIPARYAATRLPGKPLRELAGRPMIAHVIDRARESGAREVVVATDDARIAGAAEAAGARAELTRADHPSGSDRIDEVAGRLGWAADDIVVNLQGDEPCMPGALVARVAAALAGRPGAGIATVATPIESVDDLFDANVVKVVTGDDACALYFSRAPIPWVRDAFAAGRPPALPAGVEFLRHLGLYAYRVNVLARMCRAEPRAVERAESLEQLRALALGIDIHVSIVDKSPGHGVDTEDDLRRAERSLAGDHGG